MQTELPRFGELDGGNPTGKKAEQTFRYPETHAVFTMTNVTMCHHIYSRVSLFDPITEEESPLDIDFYAQRAVADSK